MTASFCAQPFDRETNSDLSSVPCQAEQFSRTLPTDAVGEDRQLPQVGDDEAFAERLQRAWQKMLDDELTFGGDWTSEIDGGRTA
jgi:hypothetical protein